MNEISPIKRLLQIAEFIVLSSSRNQIVSYLSSHVCPFGEDAGVGTAILKDEGVISVDFRFGFSDSIPQPPDVQISSDHPSACAFRTLEMQTVDMRRIKRTFRDINPKVRESGDYAVAISLPITSRLLYGFAFTRDVRTISNFEDYFDSIRFILAHWESSRMKPPNISRRFPDLLNKKLTTRQETILELIKSRHTNSTIAIRLGYSESLVRQETIAIYRKLGVEGRREILAQGGQLVG